MTMEPSSGELLPPDKPREHPTDQVVVGALSRASRLLATARGSDRSRTPVVVDAALGAGTLAVYAMGTVAEAGWRITRPVRSLIARPPLVPARYHPATLAEAVIALGEQYRLVSELAADAVMARLVRQVVDVVLQQIDLTALVLEQVDLDRVIATVDIDKAVRRLDLTALVVDNVALDDIVATVDLNRAVAGVDIDAIAARIDIGAIIDRVDIAGIALQVIDEIDLPEIIRQSTGSVASEAVRGVRMQSIEADQAIQRTVDRLLLRRRARRTQAPEESGS
jgi:hypothetical protein